METISISYTITFVVDFAPEYKFTKYKECFNVKTGRRIKQISNNGTLGYKIRGKFYSVNNLRKHLVKPVKEDCPF